jgi:hypothetical protein
MEVAGVPAEDERGEGGVAEVEFAANWALGASRRFDRRKRDRPHPNFDEVSVALEVVTF